MFKPSLSLLTVLLTVTSLSAHAQMADRLTDHPVVSSARSKATADEAVAITRDMTNRLHLNEGQFLNLLPLNRTKLAGLKTINREYQHDEPARAAKAAELEAQFEQECGRILTPSQLSQLQQEKGQLAPANTGNGLG